MNLTPKTAPILSNGLGNVELGDSLEVVREKLGDPITSREGKVPSAELKILEYAVVCVVLAHGLVTNLLALEGYIGKTDDGLFVGMTWREFQRAVSGASFDEDLYCWSVPGRPWLEISVVRPSHDGDGDADETVEEWYEVTDPDRAWIDMLAVRRPSAAT